MQSRRNNTGYFVAVDGPNGSGKTTVINAIAEKLGLMGYKVKTTREPTNSILGEFVRKYAEGHKGLSIACMVTADRYEHIKNEIDADQMLPACLVAVKIQLEFQDKSVALAFYFELRFVFVISAVVNSQDRHEQIIDHIPDLVRRNTVDEVHSLRFYHQILIENALGKIRILSGLQQSTIQTLFIIGETESDHIARVVLVCSSQTFYAELQFLIDQVILSVCGSGESGFPWKKESFSRHSSGQSSGLEPLARYPFCTP